MKLVSRKVLESLLKSGAVLKNAVSEGEKTNEFSFEKTNEFSFEEFVQEYEKTLNTFAKDRSQTRQSVFMSTYNAMKEKYLKNHCPPIEYCGEGSSRAAYACSDGKCLKVAMNEKGIAQNKQEISNLQNDGNDNPKYLCFARLYEWDEKGSSLMTECCSKALETDFERLYNSPNGVYALYNVLKLLVDFKFDFDIVQKTLRREYKDIELNAPHYNDEINIASWKIECVQQIEKGQAIQWKILRELCEFYKKVGVENLDLGDLANIENWGMAIREGQIVPVIIDAGLSLDIYDSYYA